MEVPSISDETKNGKCDLCGLKGKMHVRLLGFQACLRPDGEDQLAIKDWEFCTSGCFHLWIFPALGIETQTVTFERVMG